jgi:hypothetical protein
LDASLPFELREFFSAYSSCTESSTKLSAVKRMLGLHEKYVLYNVYLRMGTKPSEELKQLLLEEGRKPKQGQGWATVMLGFLADQLHLTKQKLTTMLQDAQCVHLMIATFGVGVLVLVPRGILNL